MSTPLFVSDVSPLGRELREDAAGRTHGEVIELFDRLAAQAAHALRQPQDAARFEANGALLKAAELARRIVDEYWTRHHGG